MEFEPDPVRRMAMEIAISAIIRMRVVQSLERLCLTVCCFEPRA